MVVTEIDRKVDPLCSLRILRHGGMQGKQDVLTNIREEAERQSDGDKRGGCTDLVNGNVI